VRDYYALMPDNLDAGYALLTDNYKDDHASSRSSYAAFWGDIDDVSVSNVSGSSPGSVTATITYEFEDGRVYVERHSYSLVEEDGILKIDESEVLSSRQL
jgi:eukaryotic-like serine/threonine-protein kinase